MTLKGNRCNKSSRAIVKYTEKNERKYFEQAIEFEQKLSLILLRGVQLEKGQKEGRLSL